MDNIKKSTLFPHNRSLDESTMELDISYKNILEASLREISFIKSLEVYKTINSTNTHASKLALEGAPEGTLVVADFQTRGRGRWNRTWFASPGNFLLFSFVLRPLLSLGETNLVGLALALAIVRSMDELGVQAAIKWPNDIMVPSKKGERKLAGILVEFGTRKSNSEVNYAVLGAGINVKGDKSVFPEELAAVAISLEELGINILRSQLLRSLFLQFIPLYHLLQINRQKFIEEASQKLQVGREVRLFIDQRQTEGKVIGLGNSGEIVIETVKEELTIPVREVERVVYMDIY